MASVLVYIMIKPEHHIRVRFCHYFKHIVTDTVTDDLGSP